MEVWSSFQSHRRFVSIQRRYQQQKDFVEQVMSEFTFTGTFNVMQELRAFSADVPAVRRFQVWVLMPGNWFGWKKDLLLLCSGSPRAFQGRNQWHMVMLGVLGLLLTWGGRPPSFLTPSSALNSHHLLTDNTPPPPPPHSCLPHQRAHRRCQCSEHICINFFFLA